jgi:hypothetical protein
MAANWAAGKLKPREEMPIYGNQHGDLTDRYGRRFEGAGPGIAGGAVQGMGYGSNPGLVAATGGLSLAAGALGGAIAGAATKNAPSAFSDFSSKDAYQAVADAYQKYLGREAGDDEIMGQLRGQGYKPEEGHRWVGQTGLFSVLDSLAASPEAQAYQARLGSQVPGAEGAQPAAMPPLNPGASGPSLDSTVRQLTPDQAAMLNAYYDAAPQRQAAFNTETQRLTANGWNGQDATRGGPSDIHANNAQYQQLLASFGGGEPTASTWDGARGGVWNPNAPKLDPTTGQYTTPTNQGFEVQGAAAGQPNFDFSRLSGGWDMNKFNSDHDSPKYQIGRALLGSGWDPSTGLGPEQIQILQNLGLADRVVQTGDDTVRFEGSVDPRFNGITEFDLIQGLKTGAGRLNFEPVVAGGAGQGNVGQVAFGRQNPTTLPAGLGGGQTGYGADGYSDLVLQYLLQGLGLDRAAARLER